MASALHPVGCSVLAYRQHAVGNPNLHFFEAPEPSPISSADRLRKRSSADGAHRSHSLSIILLTGFFTGAVFGNPVRGRSAPLRAVESRETAGLITLIRELDRSVRLMLSGRIGSASPRNSLP